jgi:hypothetical protein
MIKLIMLKRKRCLYYIYCALGQKSHPTDNKIADKVAFIRLIITTQILVTNLFIMTGVVVNILSIIHHWSD